MTKTKTLDSNINLLDEAIFVFANIGIKRAYAFAGVWFNPANEHNINTYHLPSGGNINTTINISSSIEDIQENFGNWLITNGLREIIESYGLTIINLFDALNIAINTLNAQEELKRFKKYTFPEKVKKVNELLDKKLYKDMEFLTSMQDLRNALTHNFGVVDKDSIELTFPIVEVFGINSKGEEIEIIFGERLGQELDLCIRFLYDKRIFKRGDRVKIDPEYFSKLCFGAERVLCNIKQKTIEILKENGVKVKIDGNK